jgi:hypothetical protein
MQVSGASQSFNAVNTLRLLGGWMRMFTIPNQSSVAKAFQEFDENGRMKPSGDYDRIVDVMEDLLRFTVLLRPHAAQLVEHFSERKSAGIGVDPEARSINHRHVEAVGWSRLIVRCDVWAPTPEGSLTARWRAWRQPAPRRSRELVQIGRFHCAIAMSLPPDGAAISLSFHMLSTRDHLILPQASRD